MGTASTANRTMYSALRTFVKRAAPAGQHAATAPNVQSIWLNVCRGMATGPAAGGHISDELLDKLGSLSTQALIDGLWVMGWPTSHIMGARPLTEGQKKNDWSCHHDPVCCCPPRYCGRQARRD